MTTDPEPQPESRESDEELLSIPDPSAAGILRGEILEDDGDDDR